jgi:hypothetical protein
LSPGWSARGLVSGRVIGLSEETDQFELTSGIKFLRLFWQSDSLLDALCLHQVRRTGRCGACTKVHSRRAACKARPGTFAFCLRTP